MNKPRIQDDLYTYVNQEKLDELVIPDDLPCVGGFQTLAIDVEKIMINEFNEMTETKQFPNEHLSRACKLYEIAKDADKKAKFGVAPVLKYLEAIKNINSIEMFNKEFKSLMLNKLPNFSSNAIVSAKYFSCSSALKSL